jgi:PAS domain S-box-containing protein
MSARSNGEGWEALFWVLFQESSNPIVLVDEQRRFIELNDAALALLGYSRGALMGRPLTEVIAPAERAESTRAWHTFLRTGEYEGTRSFMRADGTEIPLDFAARLTTIGGRRLGVYVTMIPDPLPSPDGAQAIANAALTPREREVVTEIAMGRDTAEIAGVLQIAPETVRTHVRNAMAKLGARTRAQLVAVALCREGAITLPRTG